MKSNFDLTKVKTTLLEQWFGIKVRLHIINRHPSIHEGEIWWCNFGENIGVEINGKKRLFLRPVLIFKKYSKNNFLGLPLTSQTHHVGSWYAHFRFQGKESVCILNQGRSLSVNRLYKRMGEIDETDFSRIREGYILLHW